MSNNMCDRQVMNNISIASWNSRCLVTSLPYLHNLFKTNDIITLSEHWLHANKLNTLAEISDDFNVIARASKHSDASTFGYKRGQGGVALLWRKTLGGVSPITSVLHDRICGIRIQGESGRVVNILSIYLPAPGSRDDLSVVLDELSEIIEGMEVGSLTIVCGDYNGDVGHLGGPRSTRRPTAQGRKIVNFFSEFSLFPSNLCDIAKGPLNTFRGGVGSSTIDYVAIPNSLLGDLISSEVLTDEILNTSDHNAVRAVLNLEGVKLDNCKPDTPPNIRWNRISKPTLVNEYTIPMEEFCEDLLQSTDFGTLSPKGIDDVIDNITRTLVKTGDNLPKARFRKHGRPYWNGVLNDLKKKKVYAYRRWSAEGRPRDALSQSWVAHKEAKRNFRRELKRVQRDYDRKQIQELVEFAECDRNKFWKRIKKLDNPSSRAQLPSRIDMGRLFRRSMRS